MPNLLAFEPAQFLGFVIILGRISGLIVSAPVLGDRTIPVQVKAGFAFILSLIFYPIVAAPQVGSDPNIVSVVLITISEVGVGLLIGFSARLLFTGIAMAGEVIGFQMGIGIANVFDPSSDTQVPLIGQIQLNFTMLLFVILNGHLILIRALVMSYRLIKPGGLRLTEPLFHFLMDLAAKVFVVGLQVGAPLIVAMLAANFSIGLIARSVPQVNVFVVGFPFTIALGLLLLALGFPFFIEAVHALISQLETLLLTGLSHG
ncbi:MAG TPA: flagellar biosynthetic protein FliR [bacterium]|nr:flagellar biosynthetic protein FliR [bacterium]